MSTTPKLDAVARAVRDAGADASTTDVAIGAIECGLIAPAVPAFADRLAGLGPEPQWIAAADTRATSGRFTLAYHFAPPTHRPTVTARVAVDATFPSLATRSFAASRFERERFRICSVSPPQGIPIRGGWPCASSGRRVTIRFAATLCRAPTSSMTAVRSRSVE